ncbi:unnamed protein product [Cuscuta campestris]|uniref:Uncharacterized protein n=1 Tax=Cuscuta campestris TaxID=132261 RepID=A0A484KE99_9ASTE|nr:unnamed protein product [Cuscuta campestris]
MLGILVLLLFVMGNLTISCCSGAGSTAGCIASERLALLEFKQGLVDDSNRLSSWSGDNCCRWNGVTCDNITGNIVKLDLRNRDETSSGLVGGEISSSLLNLTRLGYLDLSTNDFSGARIPNFIGSLAQLRYLNLSSSRFMGNIPHSLGNLSNLQYLDLRSELLRAETGLFFLSMLSSLKYLDMSSVDLANASNWLRDLSRIPSLSELRLSGCKLPLTPPHISKGNLTSLSTLILDSNNFNSTLPSWLFNISSIEHLDLSYCYLHGSIPREIGNLKLLSVLVLSSNHLAGEIPVELSGLCNLRELDLDYNNFVGGISTLFGNPFGCIQRSLESVTLESNSLSGSLPNQLGDFEQLKIFNAFQNSIQGSLPNGLGRMKNLEFLALSGNSIGGPIPTSIGRLSRLKEVHLADNLLNGSVPKSLGQLSSLQILDLGNNSLGGVVTELHLSNLRSLRRLSIHRNSLLSFDIDPAWVPPFQLELVLLSSTKVGPKFPLWLKEQVNITVLMMSNASISSSIPSWFGDISSGIQWLDLSHNLITGNLPKLRNYSALDPFRCIFLNSNRFQGPLPHLPSDINMLDISNNMIHGVIPQNIGATMPNLQYLRISGNRLNGSMPASFCKIRSLTILDLSDNQLSGTLPSTCSQWNLEVLDLSSNNFSGSIPAYLGSLTGLQSLHLENNSLHGKIPESLKNLSYLSALDLSQNALDGAIPSWIGENWSSLKVLNLHSNRFNSEVPLKLCTLSSLRILNVANNELSGKIPACFSNFTGMVVNGVEGPQWDFGIDDSPNVADPQYVENVFGYMKGRELFYSNTLRFLFSIDLSRNNLSGQIPHELTGLRLLQNLNLSRNNLNGQITPSIGNMTALESLDLSRNQFSGAIPPAISSLNFLSYLDLSYNNLSGPIPRGNQLQTLDKSSYVGNIGLCGPPLGSCHGDDKAPPHEPQKETAGLDDDGEVVWFFSGLGAGFIAGLVGVCSILYFKSSWRRKCNLWVVQICSRLSAKRTVRPNLLWARG